MDTGGKATPSEEDLRIMRSMSPKRKSTQQGDADALVAEQLAHYQIDPQGDYGKVLARIVKHLYECSADLNRLWKLTIETIDSLDRSDRVAYFNAKKFLAFQIAKL